MRILKHKGIWLTAAGFFLPFAALAATTDFTANADITISSVTFDSTTADMLILSGSTAESWSFSSGTFTVTNPGTFNVGSSDSSVKAIQVTLSGTSVACAENTTPGTSAVTLPTDSGTYTVSPSSTTDCTTLCSTLSNVASYNSFPTCGAATCTAGHAISGSGSSAICTLVGGGGIYSACSPGYQLSGSLCYSIANSGSSSSGGTPVVSSQSVQTPSSTSRSVSSLVPPVFSRDLGPGISSEEVRRLQSFLATDKEVYPEGLVTGYYGGLTERAVQKFQAKYGIVSSGNPSTTGYGILGPKTRAMLQVVFGTPGEGSSSRATPIQTGISAAFERTLRKGTNHPDVVKLQELLNSDPDTQIAESGPGSPGKETSFFGTLTERAVQKFQTKYDIVSSGSAATTGYGILGPKTREKLQEVFQ